VNGVESIPKLDWDKFVDTFDQLESSRDKLDYLLAVLEDFGVYLIGPNAAVSVIARRSNYIKLVIPGIVTITFTRNRENNVVDIVLDWFGRE
jgi:hypothetical protein